MSDIWHKAGFHEAIDDKLKVSKDGKWVYWTVYGWNIADEDVHDIGCEWAYLDDLLACEQELIRTRKALNVAVDALKLMYQGNGDPQDIMRYIDNRWTPVRRLCKQALEQITALEQKDK